MKEEFDIGEQYNLDWLKNEIPLQYVTGAKIYKDQVLLGWRSFFGVRTMVELVSQHTDKDVQKEEFERFLEANIKNHMFLVKANSTAVWKMRGMFVKASSGMRPGPLQMPMIVRPPMKIHLCESPQYHPVHGKFVAWSTLYGREK